MFTMGIMASGTRYAAAPTSEILVADGIALSSGLTGSVSDIDYDPPNEVSPTYLIATSNNVNTELRATLPTPSASPTVGANLQTIYFQIRKTAGSNTTVRLNYDKQLWENGVLIRSLGVNSALISPYTGSMTWNANELSNADGSQVEFRIIVEKSGYKNVTLWSD